MLEENTEEPGRFSIFVAEGESLAKQGEYLKAIESFSKVCSACSWTGTRETLSSLISLAVVYCDEELARLSASHACTLLPSCFRL